MQLTQLGNDAFTGTVTNAITHLQSLTGTNRVLILVQENFPTNTLPDITTENLISLEDWISAITYRLVDVTTTTQNSERLTSAFIQPTTLDTGFFVTGQTFFVRPVIINFYTPANLTDRPSPTEL